MLRARGGLGKDPTAEQEQDPRDRDDRRLEGQRADEEQDTGEPVEGRSALRPLGAIHDGPWGGVGRHGASLVVVDERTVTGPFTSVFATPVATMTLIR